MTTCHCIPCTHVPMYPMYLGEFFIVSHDPYVAYNVFRCHSKDLVKRGYGQYFTLPHLSWWTPGKVQVTARYSR